MEKTGKECVIADAPDLGVMMVSPSRDARGTRRAGVAGRQFSFREPPLPSTVPRRPLDALPHRPRVAESRFGLSRRSFRALIKCTCRQ